ncbi:MAG: hypothetical protein LBT53_00490 [Puniceicoccales bacterium]|jgi:hypothetical protein|nr:hypothetical protein [Puniceicoccales bacterium]
MEIQPDITNSDSDNPADATATAADAENGRPRRRPRPPRTAGSGGWFWTTAPLCAGMSACFLFWREIPGGGLLTHGVSVALGALFAAAALAYFLFCVAPVALAAQNGGSFATLAQNVFGHHAAKAFVCLVGLAQLALCATIAVVAALWLAAVFHGAETRADAAEIHGNAAHLALAATWLVLSTLIAARGAAFAGKAAFAMLVLTAATFGALLFKTLGGLAIFNPAALTQKLPAAVAATGDTGIFAVAFGTMAALLPIIALTACDLLPRRKTQPTTTTATATNAAAPAATTGGLSAQLGVALGVLLALAAVGAAVVLVVAGGQKYIAPIPELVGGADPLDLALIRALLHYTYYPWFGALLALSAFPASCAFALAAINNLSSLLPHFFKKAKTPALLLCAAPFFVLVVMGWAGMGNADLRFNSISNFTKFFAPICGILAAEALSRRAKNTAAPKAAPAAAPAAATLPPAPAWDTSFRVCLAYIAGLAAANLSATGCFAAGYAARILDQTELAHTLETFALAAPVRLSTALAVAAAFTAAFALQLIGKKLSR